MLLAVDVGNTRAKCAVFDGNAILKHVFFDASQAAENLRSLTVEFAISDIIVASVGNIGRDAFLPLGIPVLFLGQHSKWPFKNLYGTPKTLGVDRMALAAGAVLAYPSQNRLVIDAGTCITYDFITNSDEYLGGAISPGLRLRYESLHRYTANLPLLEKQNEAPLIGNSTAESIHSGVINGAACEIDGFIDAYRKGCSNFIIILTGGDSKFLAERLKNGIFAHSNFLVESLNHIFQYQNQA